MQNNFTLRNLMALPWRQRDRLSLPLSFSIACQLFAASALVLSISMAAVAETAAPKDSLILKNYRTAILYLPDPQTQQLIPRDTLVPADKPVVGAVGQIVQGYRGQNICIHNYEVKINPNTRAAVVRLDSDRLDDAALLQGLSSNNQLALFEAIRQTLLTQPEYNIKEVNFAIGSKNLDI